MAIAAVGRRIAVGRTVGSGAAVIAATVVAVAVAFGGGDRRDGTEQTDDGANRRGVAAVIVACTGFRRTDTNRTYNNRRGQSRGISDPKSLEGKKLGAPAPDGAYAQWPIFVEANKIDASKVTIENVGFPVREPMLAAGQVDAITGFSFSSFINLKDKGVPVDDIVVLLMADYGVNLYGNAIIVNPKFAAEKPEAVKAFLRAFVKGLKDTVKSPETAVDSVLKRNDVAKKPTELERLTMAIRDNLVTSEVKANGYGGIDSARFDKAIDQIGLTYKWKGDKPKTADIFDSSFLPAAADRKF